MVDPRRDRRHASDVGAADGDVDAEMEAVMGASGRDIKRSSKHTGDGPADGSPPLAGSRRRNNRKSSGRIRKAGDTGNGSEGEEDTGGHFSSGSSRSGSRSDSDSSSDMSTEAD